MRVLDVTSLCDRVDDGVHVFRSDVRDPPIAKRGDRHIDLPMELGQRSIRCTAALPQHQVVARDVAPQCTGRLFRSITGVSLEVRREVVRIAAVAQGELDFVDLEPGIGKANVRQLSDPCGALLPFASVGEAKNLLP